MRKSYFLDQMEKIYATFGKKTPQEAVTDEIFNRIEDFPDDFMDYARSRLCDMEALPQNLGRFLARELWPDFRASRPELFTGRTDNGCPLCARDTPGYRRVWNPDNKNWVILPCPCNAKRKTEFAATDVMIHAMGWLTEAEAREARKERYPDGISHKHICGMVGHREETGKEHKAYMAEMEGVF